MNLPQVNYVYYNSEGISVDIKEEEAVAKERIDIKLNTHRFFVRESKNGGLFNPNTINAFLHMDKLKFRELQESQFDRYLLFLSSKKEHILTRLDREIN